MQDNLAYEYEDEVWEELIDGEVVAMSPRPYIDHNQISLNIYSIFRNYLKGKPGRAFGFGVDLYLTEKDRYIPDVMVVCDRGKITPERVEGTPDLVVEILSMNTVLHDRGKKRNAYERAGVREYWIIDPVSKRVEVYLLQDGKFEINGAYTWYPEEETEDWTEEERATLVPSFQCGLFEDLTIYLKDIFEDML